ncbi:hypothetical protein Tco_1141299 [Tanacetum coccineum]
MDRSCDYHQEKGHHTNDCHHLRRQLEAALESAKLNHQHDRDQIPEREEEEGKRCNRKIDGHPHNISSDLDGRYGGASVEVMFEHRFENLSPTIKTRLKETQMGLVGFTGEATKPLGKIELEVCFGNEGLCRRTTMKFTVIRAPTPYNVILGRTGLRALRAIPSTMHSMMKFPTLRGITTLVTRRRKACKAQLKLLLKDNMDIFAWEPADMTGVPRSIIEHKLNVNTSVELKLKKRRVLAPEKSEVVTRYVSEWVKAGIVRPVRYPTWIANPIKKAKATYQRLIDSTFQSQIGRNLKAYVDNMVIKSNDEKMLLADVAETFDNLRKINMKLNLKKCSFGVEEGKFLGYMVTSEGIRANPKKTRILADLQSPRTLKEMQSLARKLAALNRFLAKSVEKYLPFFNTLKNITKENKHEYKWIIKAEEAFQERKQTRV